MPGNLRAVEIFYLVPHPDFPAVDFLFEVYQVANSRETLEKILLLWNFQADADSRFHGNHTGR